MPDAPLPEIPIYAPSYKRAARCYTHKYLTQVTYVVRESEAAEYQAVHSRVWVVPDSAQGNVARIRNYILDHAEAQDFVMVDDDLSGIKVWEIQPDDHKKQRALAENEVYELIELGARLCREAGAVLWGLNPTDSDAGAYREYTPFSFTSFVGGPFCGHCSNPMRYDEKLGLKEDYDLCLQVLNKCRRVFRMNMYSYVNSMAASGDGLPGGCSTYRTLDREREQLKALQAKWGSSIVRKDSGAGSMRKKQVAHEDLNPILSVPIPGV